MITEREELRERLLEWYDAERRHLPWRAAPGGAADPYAVWVSEVMLQQTRVETVIPYFARWMARFPDVGALAAAARDEVMKAWEGLGYYSRARNLHRAAVLVVERHGGRIPAERAGLRSLPGVGRYTSGAVLSIAFGMAEPVVDGNVRRIFARLADEPLPAEHALWGWAEWIVRGERPGDLNQAVMDLGATVCTPRLPRCASCPLRTSCLAALRGTQSQRPLPRKAAPIPREEVGTAVVRHDGRVLLARRPGDARLGGLWEFPGGERREGEGAGPAAARWVGKALGIEVEPRAAICSVVHRFTHVQVTYSAVECTHISGDPRPLRYDAFAWLTVRELRDRALSRAQRRIASCLQAPPSTEPRQSSG